MQTFHEDHFGLFLKKQYKLEQEFELLKQQLVITCPDLNPL